MGIDVANPYLLLPCLLLHSPTYTHTPHTYLLLIMTKLFILCGEEVERGAAAKVRVGKAPCQAGFARRWFPSWGVPFVPLWYPKD